MMCPRGDCTKSPSGMPVLNCEFALPGGREASESIAVAVIGVGVSRLRPGEVGVLFAASACVGRAGAGAAADSIVEADQNWPVGVPGLFDDLRLPPVQRPSRRSRNHLR